MNRKGFLNKIMCLFLMIVFLLPTGTIVNAFSTSVDINRYEMDEEQLTMQKYIITVNGHVKFDREMAIKENVNEDIITAGDIFNSLISAEYNYDSGEVQAQASIPIWGNWCGPGYGSGPPIDLLDYGCRDHDRCYGDRGYHKCSCDDDMLKYIIDNKDRMTGGQKQAANAIEAWLRIKLNNPGETGGNLSCVW